MTANLRKTILASALILFVSGFSPIRLAAQTERSQAKVITLQDALDYALQHYPAVRASLEQVSAAHAGVALARTQYLPQLSGVYQDSRATQNQVAGNWLPTPITPTVIGTVGGSSGQSFWGNQEAALFSWEPFDFGLRSARVGQARSAEEKSKADLALTRLEVAQAVGNYFLIALVNERAAKAAQANVDRWQVFGKSVHALVDNQLRPGVDVSRADAELARARAQLYRAEQAERAALDTLAALMGAAGSEIALEAGPLVDLPRPDAVPELAPNVHPLAVDLMASVRQVQAQEKVLQRTNYPRFLLQGEAFGRGSGIPNNGPIIGHWNGLAPGRANWVSGLTILFPDVFGFRARSAETQIAKSNERSQQARYDQAIQDLTGQVRAARDELKSARLIAQETPTELTAARQSETQSRARYEAGLATLVEVSDAENLLAQAEADDAIARLNVWRGLLGVAHAQGDLQPFVQLLRGAAGGK